MVYSMIGWVILLSVCAASQKTVECFLGCMFQHVLSLMLEVNHYHQMLEVYFCPHLDRGVVVAGRAIGLSVGMHTKSGRA